MTATKAEIEARRYRTANRLMMRDKYMADARRAASPPLARYYARLAIEHHIVAMREMHWKRRGWRGFGKQGKRA